MIRHRPNPRKKNLPKKLVRKPSRNVPARVEASRMECVYVTPDLARDWLSNNIDNRPKSTQEVIKLRQALHINEWRVNGATIKFDTNGVLRDGQGRLEAIATAGRDGKGIPAWCWVCYDIDTDCFDTIDQGRIRTLGHLLAVHRYKNYVALATAIRLIYNLSKDDIHKESGGFVNRVGLHIVQSRPEIIDSVSLTLCIGIWSKGRAAGLHHLMSRVAKEGGEPSLADDYWEALGNGVITSKRSPIRAVRDKMVQNQMATGDRKLTDTTIAAIAIKGWNLLRAGKTCTRIGWNSETEEFPSIQ